MVNVLGPRVECAKGSLPSPTPNWPQLSEVCLPCWRWEVGGWVGEKAVLLGPQVLERGGWGGLGNPGTHQAVSRDLLGLLALCHDDFFSFPLTTEKEPGNNG